MTLTKNQEKSLREIFQYDSDLTFSKFKSEIEIYPKKVELYYKHYNQAVKSNASKNKLYVTTTTTISVDKNLWTFKNLNQTLDSNLVDKKIILNSCFQESAINGINAVIDLIADHEITLDQVVTQTPRNIKNKEALDEFTNWCETNFPAFTKRIVKWFGHSFDKIMNAFWEYGHEKNKEIE